MNINAFRNGDLKTSPTAKYIHHGKEFTAKEFAEYIKGSEEVSQDAEPANTSTTEPTPKKASSKKRRSRTDTVLDSSGEGEQTSSNVQ